MRNHYFRMLLLGAAMVVMTPRAADAGLLSWLSRLSGPGPFWGADVGVCVYPFVLEKDEPKPAALADVQQARFPCRRVRLDQRHISLNVNVGAAIAENNPLDYGDIDRKENSTAVRLLKLGTSLDFTPYSWLDVGSGVGVFYFAGPSFANFKRFYVQPVRLSVRPLLWRCNRTGDDRDRDAWLGLSANWVIHLGTLDGTAFGAPSDPYRSRNEHNLELGLSIDVFRFVDLLKRK